MTELPEHHQRIPPPLARGQSHDFSLSHFIYKHQQAQEGHPNLICGLKLPHFQRAFVWTQEQQVCFMESCWLELDIGRFVITESPDADEYDNLIIDGQQRLTTLQRYLNNEFPVYGLLWKELTRNEKRRMDRVHASTLVISKPMNEPFLRELYNRLNFSGTPHQQHERA
ncbi:DUF262 domain-containing protein [Deinococcus misasensis]|uniref:DUF262 domain-containing protein n=1 Tax=Deinococcus misasensis TaxID=392413 RepID=UPI00054F2909|nr:DUF262 domain-containing protein [Deinococcus misasensis]